MGFYAVLCLTVCLSVPSLAQLVADRVIIRPKLAPVTSVFDVDLRTGATSGLPAGVTWHSRLTSNRKQCTCDRQGVLKLTFGPTRVRAEINMTFEDSQGWTFNLGDSVSNNGWAGDGGSQSNDAEVHSLNHQILFYGRDRPAPLTGSYGLLYSEHDFVGVAPYTTLTLQASDGLATADNSDRFLYVSAEDKLFALSGQPDSEGGINRDLYLGMNRVVAGSYRSGTGLCRVTVRFYPA